LLRGGYEALLALRGDRSSPRISYLDGAVELMSPSKGHERIKGYLGRLAVTFAIERGIELSPYGSWTLKQAPKEAGVEPDECYLIGADQARETPDLVIEVVWTSGGIDKLEAYRRLGVEEVWFWKSDALQVYVRRADVYVPVQESAALPGLDLALLCAMLEHPTATQAIKAFRAALTA
jgi:Uma2 family endonuclease